MPPRSRVSTALVELGPRGLVPMEIHRVATRRHIHLLVDERGVVQLRAPWRYPLERGRALVSEHAQWLCGQIARVEARRASRPALVSGTRLPLLDETLELRVRLEAQMDLGLDPPSRHAARVAAAVVRRGATLWVTADRPGVEAVREPLIAWYRRASRPLLVERLGRLGDRLGLQPRRVRIAAQRSRWGSCSSTGTISLNWRLVLLPSELADYVLAHELCHLRHMDHSRTFWALVGSVIPDYRSRRARVRAQEECLAL